MFGLDLAGVNVEQRQPGGVDEFLRAGLWRVPLAQMQDCALARMKAAAQAVQAQYAENPCCLI